MSPSSSLEIYPGATWTASNGRHIQAHGGGIIKVGAKYYWHGEEKTEGTEFQAINCYSSEDLVRWDYEMKALTVQESGDLGPDRIVERPKVVYNKPSAKYVMYIHIDVGDYSEAKVGVATCDTVNGRFEYKGSFRPMGFESRDMDVFIDEDDKGYLISEDRPNGVHIFELSSDYQAVVKHVHMFPEHLESPAMIKKDGLYYLFASGLTFWFANDNLYTTSPSLAGPWAEWRMFAKPASATYSSQVNFVLPVGDSVLYMGDRWQYPGLPRSTYVWLPMKVQGPDVTMDNTKSFHIDLDSGNIVTTVPSKEYQPEPRSSGPADTGAVLASFAFETRSMTGGITIAFRYTALTENERTAFVSVNDSGPRLPLAFLGSANPAHVAVSTVHLAEPISAGKHRLTSLAYNA
ncbi:glycosyl hydrolase [Aspergillus spectabilis]